MSNRSHEIFCAAIDKVLQEVGNMLKEKNKKYGNSIVKPTRIFSKASVTEQIDVRIDDKLSRLMYGDGNDTEDTEWDLLGYLIIKRANEKGLFNEEV